MKSAVLTRLNWRVESLSEISQIDSGLTKGRRLFGNAINLPYLRVANVQAGRIDLDDMKGIEVLPDEIDKYRLRKGDVVMTEGGDPDKLGRGALWDGSIEPCVFQNHIFRVRLNQEVVLPAYFVRFLGTQHATSYFLQAAKQTTGIATINKTQLSKLPVIVPPLSEQRRIADILDKADAIRRKRKQAIALTDQLLRSTFLEMFGDPVTNSKGFPSAILADVATFRSGDFLPAREMDKDGIYPVYGGNGITGFHGSYMFQEPMVVVGRVGVYCGATHLTKEKSWITDNALYVASMSPSLTKTYLYHALVNANLNQYASQSAQPLISGSRLGRVPVLIPPVPVQQRFAELVMSHEVLSQRQRQSEEHAVQLFGALVDRAFRGELSRTEQFAGQLSMF